MVGTKIHFMAEQAPCGKIVPGDHYEDRDDYGLVIRDEYYDCGCRRIRHEYHDGTITTTATRHGRRHGKLISEEHSEHPV